MAEYGVTAQGFNMKRFDVLLKEVQSELSDALGFDVSQNPQSLLNSALILPFVDKVATLWEVAQDSYYAKFPSTAEGINLDNACQYGSVFREGNRATKYIIHCRSVEGTIITADGIIQSDTNPPVRLKCDKAVETTRSSCNVIAVRPTQVEATRYEISINGIYNAVYDATNEDTLQSICEGLRDALNAVMGDDPEFELAMSEANDFLLIKDKTLSRADDFVLSASLTTEYVVSLVDYYTEDYGDIYVPYGSITKIVTNVTGPTNSYYRSGLFKISNLLEPTPGRLQQQDWEFRQSYLKKAYINSFGMTDSIDSYIIDTVDGVTSVKTFQNDTNEYDPPEAEQDPTIKHRPPHSIEVVVYGEGYDMTKVAQCIWEKKSAGIQTCGNQSVDITGAYGDTVTVRFTTPTAKNVWLKIVITTDGGNIADDYKAKVINSILEETRSLEVGQTLKIQTLIDNVYAVLDGVDFCRITSATGDTEPESSEYEEQNITADETEVLKLSADRIEVELA